MKESYCYTSHLSPGKPSSKSITTYQKIDQETIELKEEKNYELIEKSKAKSFRERLDVFFKEHPQEDLLAFAEDVLSDNDEDDETISSPAKEPIFIAIKTIVDAFDESASRS